MVLSLPEEERVRALEREIFERMAVFESDTFEMAVLESEILERKVVLEGIA